MLIRKDRSVLSATELLCTRAILPGPLQCWKELLTPESPRLFWAIALGDLSENLIDGQTHGPLFAPHIRAILTSAVAAGVHADRMLLGAMNRIPAVSTGQPIREGVELRPFSSEFGSAGRLELGGR